MSSSSYIFKTMCPWPDHAKINLHNSLLSHVGYDMNSVFIALPTRGKI